MPIIIVIFVSFCVSVLFTLIADAVLTERVSLLGSFAGLELSHNPGIAFGLRLPPALQSLLIGLALCVVGWMAVRSVRLPRTRCEPAARSYALAYGLILGGGIANIIDRIPDGLVTDYFQVGTFPVFNVADSCITIGVGVLLWGMLIQGRVCRQKPVRNT